MILNPCQQHDKFTELEEQNMKEEFRDIPSDERFNTQHELSSLEEKLNTIKETIKFDEGKPCISDIPQHSLMSVAKVFNYGAKKYSKFNYSGGTDWLRYYDATQRHLNAWMISDDIDSESNENHIDHAIASLLMLRENIHLKTGVDNRNPIYKTNGIK